MCAAGPVCVSPSGRASALGGRRDVPVASGALRGGRGAVAPVSSRRSPAGRRETGRSSVVPLIGRARCAAPASRGDEIASSQVLTWATRRVGEWSPWAVAPGAVAGAAQGRWPWRPPLVATRAAPHDGDGDARDAARPLGMPDRDPSRVSRRGRPGYPQSDAALRRGCSAPADGPSWPGDLLREALQARSRAPVACAGL